MLAEFVGELFHRLGDRYLTFPQADDRRAPLASVGLSMIGRSVFLFDPLGLSAEPTGASSVRQCGAFRTLAVAIWGAVMARAWDGLITPLARPRWSWRMASTSAAPVLFAGLESTAGAFGYLSKRLQMRDCGLFGRPRSHDPLLAIWLDGFNPIGAAEWNDPVGLHEVDIATIRSGAQRLRKG